MLWTLDPWWLVLVLAAVFWIPQNATHEGAHALVAKHWGQTITRMWLYPNGPERRLSLTPWKKGHAWARVSWRGKLPENVARGLIYLAPVSVNTLVLFFVTSLFWRFDLPQGVAIPLSVWALTNYIDGAYNLGTFYLPGPRSSDGWSYLEALQLNPRYCRIAAVVWHLWFGFHLFFPV